MPQKKAEEFYKRLTGYGFGQAGIYFGQLHSKEPDDIFNEISAKIDILDELFNYYRKI